MTKRGLFMTFEGIHGAGKSTTVMKLTKKLSEQGYQTIHLHDQSGTAVGKELRKINLGFDTLAPLTEALIVGAARHQSIREIIKPNLQKGKIVICERFTDAFMAYAFARDMTMSIVKVINRAIADGISPDLTVLLDLDPVVAIERISLTERHRFERENLEFHSRMRDGYLKLAREQPERIKVVDASGSPDSLFLSVWTKVADAILQWRQ